MWGFLITWWMRWREKSRPLIRASSFIPFKDLEAELHKKTEKDTDKKDQKYQNKCRHDFIFFCL